MAFKYGVTKKVVERPVFDGLELALLIEHLQNTNFVQQYNNIYRIGKRIKDVSQTPTVAGDIMKKLRIAQARIEATEFRGNNDK